MGAQVNNYTFSFFFGLGVGTTKDTLTITGKYKAITRKFVFLCFCLTYTKFIYLNI